MPRPTPVVAVTAQSPLTALQRPPNENMPELRQDPVTGRWVVISTERRKRPSDFWLERHQVARDGYCPFCPGREDLTPPEVLAYRQSGGRNGPGWDLRVVPNKFPALQVEGGLDREG